MTRKIQNSSILLFFFINLCHLALSNQIENICNLPKRVGKCRALSWRVYYDSETKTCKEFGYGGCDGNKNNFNSAEECIRMCYNLDNEESISEAIKSVKRPGHIEMTNSFKKPQPLVHAASVEIRNTEEDNTEEIKNDNDEELKNEIMEETIEDLNVLNWVIFMFLIIGITSFMVYYVKLRKRKLTDDDYVPIANFCFLVPPPIFFKLTILTHQN